MQQTEALIISLFRREPNTIIVLLFIRKYFALSLNAYIEGKKTQAAKAIFLLFAIVA